MENILNQLISAFAHLGYAGIVLLMAIESSIIPLPSELVIPPAGILAARGEMNLLWIIVAGTVGSILGATVMYWISWSLGRAVIYFLADHKIAKFLHVTPHKVEKAEKFFLKYGSISIFIGRLLPVVRHLISIPAGFCKMNFFKFLLYTALGSAIWVSVLAVGGYYLGTKIEVIAEHFKTIVEILLGFAVLGVFFFWMNKKNSK